MKATVYIPEFFDTEAKVSTLAPTGKAGAERFAALIQERWHECGHKDVRAWAEGVTLNGGPKGDIIYVVRSNLVGGLPPASQAIEVDAAA